ncbi:hypothetical protein CDAR_171691 [Caerostris darwini]|uniref:Uncharacterized protein n=1 Tax=Caerostris darwini TaxID=1538125 RepID=A0AAV4V0M1_9ARAC|nr:hypothetical protein CDAR_171691 [Caerostris darwini]
MLPKSFQNDENSSLERLIEKCPLLEILDVSTFFNLSALKYCVRLKDVRNDLWDKREYRYFRNESVDTLANLQNLEKFAIFHCRKPSSYYKHIAKMLQNHPKLVSLGNTDSSWAAHHIYTTCRMDTFPRFGLKKCFWGVNKNVEEFNRKKIAYIQQFPEFVKSSVALFPLVEKLYICNRSGGIETDSNNFRKLKKLIVYEVDKESLEYLLRNALNLRELLLIDALCFDDTLLHKIFKKNSLPQLNTIAVHECSLSRAGLKELVQKCVNLERVAFNTLDADVISVAEELKRHIRATYSYVEKNLTHF